MRKAASIEAAFLILPISIVADPGGKQADRCAVFDLWNQWVAGKMGNSPLDRLYLRFII